MVETMDEAVLEARRAASHAFANVHAAIGRMRSVTQTRQLMAVAPAELCKCGFDRVMLTRVEGSTGYPEAFHVEGDSALALEYLNAGKGDPMSLDHMLLETEMLRRRAPVLVQDAQRDPRVHKTLSEVTQSDSYVAAPIMVENRVVGFFHADAFVAGRRVDEFDRDLLWMFAEGFGAVYERAELLERMTLLRNEVRRLNHSILTVMDEAVEAEVEVERIAGSDRSVAHSAAAMYVAVDSRIESLLTPREMDVIRLMATGLTNCGIATRLVVSEGTVKSHVKHILRKLRAHNRAEAVSRFIKLSQQSAHRD
jgi:DNA-binding CsgD family transcriptional regulator